MIAPVGVLVALGTAPYEPQVLRAVSGERLRVVRRCVDLPDLLASAATRQAQAALVSADLRGLDAEIVARLGDERVVVIGVTSVEGVADEAVLRALGISFVAAADDPETLVETVAAAAAQPEAASQPPSRPDDDDQVGGEVKTGKIVAVWGPAGAPGRSVVSLGLGAQLARLGLDSLVIDADVYGGSLAQMLGMLDESSGLLAACRAANVGALRGETLSRHCRQVSPNLRVLTGLPRADRWVEAKSALVRTVVSASRALADMTVVDCAFCLELDEEISYDTTAPRRNGATIEILESADTVLVVGRADPVGLSRLIRGLNDLRAAIPRASPVVVVNRSRGDGGWTRDEVAATLVKTTGIEGVMWLPDDFAACDRAHIHGQTLPESAPGSRLTKALRKLAVAVAVAGDQAVVPRRRQMMRRGARPRRLRREQQPEAGERVTDHQGEHG
jgi:MinD-like ATPase involved in chromosome partitioning or flagellar assembly